MPPRQLVVRTRREPGARSVGDHLVGRGQVGDALGEVPVGRAVGQQRADLGHDLAEVDAVAPAETVLRGIADVEQRDPPAGPHDPASSAKNAGRSARLRSANPHVTPSTEPSGTGRRRMSACTRGAPDCGRRRASRTTGRPRSAGGRPCAGRRTGRRCPTRGRARGEPAARPSARTARRRQRTSRRNVMTRLTRS